MVSDVSTQQKALAPEISTWPDEKPQLIDQARGEQVAVDRRAALAKYEASASL